MVHEIFDKLSNVANIINGRISLKRFNLDVEIILSLNKK